MNFIKLTTFAVFLFSCLSSISPGQKISADEVLSKHLESIGSRETREKTKSMVVLTDLELIVKGSSNKVVGKAIIASAADKNIWGMTLTSADYPQDRFGYDGKEVKVGFIRPGVRSALGGFIYSYKDLLKEGLLGGTLLSSWTLLKNDSKGGKLVYGGTKKIDGEQTHVLEYQIRGGSDLSVRFYFDSQNYRHVRSEHTRFIAARQGTGIDSSAGQSPLRYQLVEEFSNFQSVNGLTIPRTYRVSYSYSGGLTAPIGSGEIEWIFTVTNFSSNQELGENAFDIDAK